MWKSIVANVNPSYILSNMNEDFVITKKKESLTESDILASLESAISSYNTKDFQQITNSTPKKKGRVKKAKVEEVIEPVLEEEVIKIAEIETPTISNETIKVKKVRKTKNKKPVIIEEEVEVVTEAPVAKTVSRESKARKIKKSKTVKTEAVKKTKTKKTRTSRKIVGTITSPFKTVARIGSNYKRQMLTTSLAFMMVAFISFSAYIAYAYVAADNNDIVQKVGNHIILPDHETPKVYIIQSDKSEILKNPLFNGIKVGDNVLSYPTSGKVIIYRSSEDLSLWII
jgi:hypothetical protein